MPDSNTVRKGSQLSRDEEIRITKEGARLILNNIRATRETEGIINYLREKLTKIELNIKIKENNSKL